MTNARERVIAWAGAWLACFYFLWLGFTLSRGAAQFGQLFEGLGAEVPPLTRFLVDHHAVLFSAAFGVAALVVLVKERFVADKRVSMMITMLLVIVVRFVVDAVITMYFPCSISCRS